MAFWDNFWWRYCGTHEVRLNLHGRSREFNRIIDWLEVNVDEYGWNWRYWVANDSLVIRFRRERDAVAARAILKWSK